MKTLFHLFCAIEDVFIFLITDSNTKDSWRPAPEATRYWDGGRGVMMVVAEPELMLMIELR